MRNFLVEEIDRSVDALEVKGECELCQYRSAESFSLGCFPSNEHRDRSTNDGIEKRFKHASLSGQACRSDRRVVS
jgi:hypothetical protein